MTNTNPGIVEENRKTYRPTTEEYNRFLVDMPSNNIIFKDTKNQPIASDIDIEMVFYMLRDTQVPVGISLYTNGKSGKDKDNRPIIIPFSDAFETVCKRYFDPKFRIPDYGHGC